MATPLRGLTKRQQVAAIGGMARSIKEMERVDAENGPIPTDPAPEGAPYRQLNAAQRKARKAVRVRNMNERKRRLP